MKIAPGLIKELREATGAGVLVCKQALEAHGGDLEKAKADLRQRGLQKAAAKAERQTGDGLVVIKREGQVTAAVHVGCETDFVARTDAFRSFVHQLTERVLADPRLDEVPALLDAPLNADSEKTVAATVRELVMRLGENITVDGVARYEEGPGRVVEGYIHAGTIEGYGPEEGRVGVLVELQADEQAEEARLRELAHDLALHIAASEPQYVALDDIPAELLAARREEQQTELQGDSRPAAIQEKIVSGRLQKWQQEVVLLEQPFIRDPSLTVAGWLTEAARPLGTPVLVTRFVRFALEE